MRLLFRFLRVGAIAALALALGTCVQRPGLLEQIAQLSGGARFLPEQFGEAVEQLAAEPAATGVTQATVIDLWDNWYVLGLFVALLSLEWFLRKRLGLV